MMRLEAKEDESIGGIIGTDGSRGGSREWIPASSAELLDTAQEDTRKGSHSELVRKAG